MDDFQEQCQTVARATMCLSISIFLFKTMYNKTIIKFGFCDIRFNQGLSKCIVISLGVRLGSSDLPQNIEKSVEKVNKKRK